VALGIQCSLRYDSAAYQAGGAWNATPVWAGIGGVSDCELAPSAKTTAVVTRDSRIERNVVTVLGLEISGKVLVNPSDPGYAALEAAFHTLGMLPILILNGPGNVVGSKGWRLDCHVTKWTEDQGPEAVLFRAFTLVPALSPNAPAIATVTGVGPPPIVAFAQPG
jgi:hypothetical protein